MVVIPAGFSLLVSGGYVISDQAMSVSPLIFGVALASLICEFLCMARVTIATIPIVVGSLFIASFVALNLWRHSLLPDVERVIGGIVLIWLLIVIAGHTRWFLILLSENANQTGRE